jgi:hypothetical protein
LRIRGEKLRRSSAFMHRAIVAEVAEAKKLFGEFRVLKYQEGQRLRIHSQDLLKGCISHRGKKQRSRPLAFGKSSKFWEENAC